MTPKNLNPSPILQKICEKSFYENPDGIIVTDSLGIIRYQNDAIRTMFGYEPKNLIGNKIEILVPAALREQHQQYVSGYRKAPHARRMSNNMALKAVRKDGTDFSVSISLQSFKEGGQSYFVAIIRDTSEYINKNEQLEKVLEQLTRIMKVSRIGTWELDHLSNKLKWTDEVYKLFDVDKNSFSLSPESFLDLVYEQDKEMVYQTFLNSLKNRIPYNIVHRVLLADGEVRFLRERCETVFSEDGSPLRSLGSVQDVTEVQKQKILLKTSLKNLQAKNDELEDYTYIAAHDLQEPLNTILGVSNLLKEEMKLEKIENADIPSYLHFIEESSLRLKGLINGIMETARLGKNIYFQDMNLDLIVEETLQGLGDQITRSNGRVVFRKLPMIRGSKIEIKMLLQNLISNALKFRKSEIDPVIKIGFNDQGHEWLFWIEDNGIGINPVYKDKLFKMFRRLHSEDEYEGTGLGLAKCKKIIELHNGEIWFESKTGEGTIFYFTISKSCCND
ncbi:MAG: sensor histidine kinase [Bacteroidota bacterium]